MEAKKETHFTSLCFGKCILIGRKSCDININDIRISSVHCEVGSVLMEDWDMFPACTAYVEDKSSNGTWLCRKEGLHSWGAFRKLKKGIKVNFSPGDFILALPPSVDALDYCAFSLESNELNNQFGLKHLTVAEMKKRITKSESDRSLEVGKIKRSFSEDTTVASDGLVSKKLCLIKESVKLELCSRSDPKVAPPPEAPPPITTHSSMEQCPNCLDLFPLDVIVEHSLVCCSFGGGNALFSEPDGTVTTDSKSSSAAVDLTGPSEGAGDLEQCIHCLKDFSVIELVTHVNTCFKRTEPLEDVKEWEHCQHCLNLFPLDEIVNHSMICSHKSTSAKSDCDGGVDDDEVLERCMHCFRDFPISELVRHMPDCTGDMCGPKERFKGFVPSVHDIDAMALSVLNDTQRRAVEYVLQRSEEDSLRAFPSLLRRVKKLGYEKEDLERTLLWVKLNAPIIIHVHLDRVLDFLLKDTHYRNLFETHTGSGSTDKSARASWEDRIFNNVYHDSAPVERVKYGVLNIVGDLRGVRSCYSYGDSFLQLKKVRLRTTFASMDTSSGSVKLSCCEHYGNVLNEYSEPELKAIIDVATRRKDHLKSDIITNYKEVQIHGPVCLSENVECIVVNDRFHGNERVEKQLEEFVTKNNCNLIWMEPDDTTGGGTTLATLGHIGPVPSVPYSHRRRRRHRGY